MADEVLKAKLQQIEANDTQIGSNDEQIGTNDLEIKGQVNALRQYGMGVTGIQRDRLGDVVYDLADGYGGGGGGVPLPIVSRAYKIEDSMTSANSYKGERTAKLISSYGFTHVQLRGGYSDAWIAGQKNAYGTGAKLMATVRRATAAPVSGYPVVKESRANASYPVIGYSIPTSIGNATGFNFLASAVEFDALDEAFATSCTRIAFSTQPSGSGSYTKDNPDGGFLLEELGCYLNSTESDVTIRAIVATYNNSFTYATTTGSTFNAIYGGLVYYYLLEQPITVPAGKYLFWASEAIT